MKILKIPLIIIMKFLAKIVLAKYKPYIIAITGSVGKTSTKEAILSTLKSSINIEGNIKSFNSEIGVPLTILKLKNAWYSPLKWLKNIFWALGLIIFKDKSYPKYLVLELGADHPSDILNNACWLKPDISIITRVSLKPVHVMYFPSPEALAKEKAELINFTKPTGSLIYFLPNQLMINYINNFNGQKISFGDAPASYRLREIILSYRKDGHVSGIEIHIQTPDGFYSFTLSGTVGYPQAYAFLASIALGNVLGEKTEKLIENIKKNFLVNKGRLSLVEAKNDSMILDDSYNSSPDALSSSLLILKDIKNYKNKVAILADMLELGEFSENAHRNAGHEVKDSADFLLAIGTEAENICRGAIDAGMPREKVKSVKDVYEAIEYFDKIDSPRTLYLIKGSQGMRLEKLVKHIMLHKDRAGELLVRQEPEWLKK